MTRLVNKFGDDYGTIVETELVEEYDDIRAFEVQCKLDSEFFDGKPMMNNTAIRDRIAKVLQKNTHFDHGLVVELMKVIDDVKASAYQAGFKAGVALS